jgi:ADP-heptose:LPS heptosyltransferase
MVYYWSLGGAYGYCSFLYVLIRSSIDTLGYVMQSPPELSNFVYPSGVFQLLILPRFLGDGLLSFTAIEGLLQHLPSSTQLVVVLPKVLHPWVRQLFPTSQLIVWDAHVLKGRAWLTYLKSIAKKCEVAYSFRRSVSEVFWLWRAGIPKRVGFQWQRYPWGYHATGLYLSKSVPYHPHHRHRHELDYWLTLLQQGCPSLQSPLSFEPLRLRFLGLQPFLTSEHFERWGFSKAMAGDIYKPLIVIHWASASKAKARDPMELLPHLCQRMQAHPSRIVLSGSPQDEVLYQPLLEALRQKGYTEDEVTCLAGKTTLADMPLLLMLADELWTLDSATVHLAALLGKPAMVRVLYAGEVAGSYPERWGILPTSGLWFKSGFTVEEMLAL